MAIYTVTVYDWEDREVVTLSGPECSDWEGYCNSLLGEAARLAIAARSMPTPDEWCAPIDDEEIQRHLVSVLVGRGYYVIEPPDFAVPASVEDHGLRDYEPDTRVLLERWRKAALAHNEKYDDRRDDL